MVSSLDLLIVLAYLIFMVVIGFVSTKKIKKQDDFVLAGRKMGYTLTIGMLVSIMIGTSATMGTAAMGYDFGMVLVWQALAILAGYIVVGLIAKKLRKTGKWYIPDIMEERYGRSAKVFTSIILILAVTAIFGAQVIAMGIIFNMVGNPLGISYSVAITIVGAILVLYTMFGGMYAVAYTDIIQFSIILLLFVVILPKFILSDSPTLEAIQFSVDPDLWSIWTGLPLLFVLGLIFTYLPGIIIDQTIWQRMMSAKDENVAKYSSFISGGIFLFYTIVILFFGIVASAVIPNLANKDEVIPQLIIQYLPNGLIGIGLVAILAVAMSTASSTILIAGVITTKDLIPSITKKQIPAQKEVKVLRITTLVLGIGGILFALTFSGIFYIMMMAYAIFTATLFFPIIFALYWKKATKAGAFWSILISSMVLITLYALDKPFDVEPILPAIVLNALLMWSISLFTYNEEKATKPILSDVS